MLRTLGPRQIAVYVRIDLSWLTRRREARSKQRHCSFAAHKFRMSTKMIPHGAATNAVNSKPVGQAAVQTAGFTPKLWISAKKLQWRRLRETRKTVRGKKLEQQIAAAAEQQYPDTARVDPAAEFRKKFNMAPGPAQAISAFSVQMAEVKDIVARYENSAWKAARLSADECRQAVMEAQQGVRKRPPPQRQDPWTDQVFPSTLSRLRLLSPDVFHNLRKLSCYKSLPTVV